MNNGITTLTPNAIRIMYQMNSSMDNEFFVPVVQVLRLKKLNDVHGDGEKWAVALSDGQHFLHGECDQELNKMIHEHVISQNAIIRVPQFAMSTRGDRKVCYIIEAQQVALNPGVFLGSPVDSRLYREPPNEPESLSSSISAEPTVPRELFTVPQSDGFFSARSKPDWQNGYRDSHARRGMIDNLERILKEAEVIQQRTVSIARDEELSTLAKKWELKLYQQAHSFENYVDKSTFEGRVQNLASSVHSQGGVYLQHHQRLHLLRHAISCKDDACSLTPFCLSMRDVWDHMQDCNELQNCQVPFCSTMKKLMHHSKSCRDKECQVCEPTVRVPGCVFCEDEEERERRRANGGSRQPEAPSQDVQTALKQEYLLTMFHASMCPHEEDGQCTLSPLCFDLKKVWMHKIYCTNYKCMYPFCATAEMFSHHYKTCSNDICQVCPPVRVTRNKHGINKITVDPEDKEVATTPVQIPNEASLDQHRPTAVEASSSYQEVVATQQAAIYKEIQQKSKRRLSGTYVASGQNYARTTATNSRLDATSGIAEMSLEDTGCDPSLSISSASSRNSGMTATEIQFREYERLAKAHQQRLRSSEANSPARSSPEIDLDIKPASLPCENNKKSSPDGSDASMNYVATAHATQKNTMHAVCTHCHVGCFMPSIATRFFCVECANVSSSTGMMH
mmetsp:Transcript_22043/g.47940  ORF Transcript_22043/g.47940 Transcript_22043/m.47940 type:complete len:677 (-) Transcript_22043:98-2128(-)|eukprot:CAMPEP_0172314448 /NCGR_PEP_ID=MMETSP1058-20130122/22553_1 /TAXON_ID=83371 /ORGANISM="Detonula confervacea, Strain CCMP 353" /LENGTH=676 /DNA_ID=CAMNT_0013028319 /DNA_START=235 /DNA_END=2265 /DNA_ORIENTATION=+